MAAAGVGLEPGWRQQAGGVTANRFVNKKQTGRHRGRRAVQHRYGVQTSRIRPIAFDIIRDVGVSRLVATVPPQPHAHVVRGGGSRLRPV